MPWQGSRGGVSRATCLLPAGMGRGEIQGERVIRRQNSERGLRVPLACRALRAMCRDIPERQRAKPSQFRRLIWSPSRCAANSKVQTSCRKRGRKGACSGLGGGEGVCVWRSLARKGGWGGRGRQTAGESQTCPNSLQHKGGSLPELGASLRPPLLCYCEQRGAAFHRILSGLEEADRIQAGDTG